MDAAENDDSSLIAGSNANAIAAAQLCLELSVGSRPPLVVFAAGRPRYLANHSDADLTEGSVLSEAFRRRLYSSSAAPPETVVLSSNRDTQDDIRELISLAIHRGLRRVGVITIRLHIPRAMAFARRCLPNDQNVELIFIPSEAVLLRRYSSRPSVVCAIQRISLSRAHSRTAAREQLGLAALQAGTYERVQQDR